MSNLWQMALIILIALGIYRFRDRIGDTLRRFDARVAQRRREEIQDRQDANAHFKHTLRLAEEQVEDVIEIDAQDERTALPVKRYVFEGATYATRAEAEEVRAARIGAIARGFYAELPRALAERRKGKLN